MFKNDSQFSCRRWNVTESGDNLKVLFHIAVWHPGPKGHRLQTLAAGLVFWQPHMCVRVCQPGYLMVIFYTQLSKMLHTADGRPTRVRPVSDQIFYYQLFLPVLYLSLIFACAHLLCNKMVRQEVMRAGFALDWPRAGLACTRSWETWLKHWKEWEWGNVRRLVYVNTTAAKDAVLYRQMQSIRRHQHWLALSRKLCKVTLNLGSYFIYFFLRGLKEINL